MKDLTNEEAAALDEYYTTHIPKVGPNEGGFFANRTIRLMPVHPHRVCMIISYAGC